ncbi:MAG: glycosyltransferase [Phycisphaerae bacterium]|nr:glycosyltransferase [Phycisphaerae bacterium]
MNASAASGRRVLMICQAFPPTGGPGVQRSAKFAKYLSRFGWQPVVWSADHLEHLPYDPSLAEDLPQNLIRRTQPAWSYTATHRRTMQALRLLGVERLLGNRYWDGLDWRLLRLWHGVSARMIPDDQLLWAIRSIRPLVDLARRERVDVLFSTYSPAANHLLGMLTQRITNLPWVADFRDLWTDDYCYRNHNRLRRRIERRIERMILRRADAVVAVTPSQTSLLSRHATSQGDKFVCIPNGVDTEDFTRLKSCRTPRSRHDPGDRFVLTFAGWFLSDRVDEGLIVGLGEFARWVRSREGHFEFRVIGTISDEMIGRFAEAGVRPLATGYLPHRDAIARMIRSDILLLPTPAGPNAETLIPGKAFEYLASGRPILLVGPSEGETARLIRQCQAGVCVESRPEAVCAALTDLWRRWRAGQLNSGCTSEHIKPFTREHLTRQLAKLLDRVCHR